MGSTSIRLDQELLERATIMAKALNRTTPKQIEHWAKIGEQKKGDLRFLRVYKFKMVKQLTLLGYSYENNSIVLELIALGSHENFYRDIKKK